MKVTLTVSTTIDVDPVELREKLNTQGLTATEATKVLKDKIFRTLDEEYSENGRYGDYTREIREDIREVVDGLGVTYADGPNPTMKVSRPDEERG